MLPFPHMASPSVKLLAWYRKSGRVLPWRNTRDPYRILVSEIMLQQTQVHRVLGYYEAWMKQFPDWKTLAAASNADIIRAWAGLGYNRRGLTLRDIARQFPLQANNYPSEPRLTGKSSKRGQFGRPGKLPSTRSAWLALKGIGPYTSAAIALFALHERVMPIDTNIRRVLGRFLLGKPFPQPSDDKRIEKRIDAILPKRGAFYDVPQALFDLATSICTKSPDCARCPLRVDCLAAKKFLAGKVRIPKQSVKKAIESRHRDKPHPDRIYRGRILKLVREEPGITLSAIGRRVDAAFDGKRDTEWIEAMIGRLEKDGLVRQKACHLFLPE